MARYAPAAAADAYRRAAQAARLSASVSPSERSFYLEALGDAEFLAGQADRGCCSLPGSAAGRARPAATEAHLALKQVLVEQRRGHCSNALRRASLGLRAVRGMTGPEAGAIRARLQVRCAVCRLSQGRYADARRWAERGLAEAEAAHELKAQAKAHRGTARRRMWSGEPEAEQHGRRRFASSSSLGTSPSRPIC